jgi:hypothetical protein
MAHWIMSGFLLLAVIMAFIYAYDLLHMMLTITKCPDCGRIMQKVLYTEWADDGRESVVYECRFCQAKRIRKGGPFGKGRRHTLYP